MTTTIGSLDLNAFSDLYSDSNQYFWFESDSSATYGAGVHITLSPDTTFISNPTGQNILMNTDGFSIRNGLLPMMTLDNNSLDFNVVDTIGGTYITTASFSSTGAQIGQAGSSRIEITERDIKAISFDDNEYFHTGTLAGTTQTLSYTADGSTIAFPRYSSYVNSPKIYVDGTRVTTGIYQSSPSSSVKTLFFWEEKNDNNKQYYMFTYYSNGTLRTGGLIDKTTSAREGYQSFELNSEQTLNSLVYCDSTSDASPIPITDYSTQENIPSIWTTKIYPPPENGQIVTIVGSIPSADTSTKFFHYGPHLEGEMFGASSLVLGDGIARGGGATSIGMGAVANGSDSFAVSTGSFTVDTTTNGSGSVAIGGMAIANGEYSFALGECVIANGENQTVIGLYNLPSDGKSKDIFIIGNGTGDTTRSNALTVGWLGEVQLYVDVDSAASETTAATSGTDMDLFNAIRDLGWYSSVIS